MLDAEFKFYCLRSELLGFYKNYPEFVRSAQSKETLWILLDAGKWLYFHGEGIEDRAGPRDMLGDPDKDGVLLHQLGWEIWQAAIARLQGNDPSLTGKQLLTLHERFDKLESLVKGLAFGGKQGIVRTINGAPDQAERVQLFYRNFITR